MSIVGRGRIVAWEGASLWVLAGATDRAETAAHSHHAIQVTLSLEGGFQLRTSDETRPGPAVAVAPDVDHVFEAHGIAALLFVEPDGALGRSLSELWFTERALEPLPAEALSMLMAELRNAFRDQCSDDALISIGQRIIGALSSDARQLAPDGRVTAMTRFIAEHLDGLITLPMIAGHVGLSSGRASHLFVEQTGLALKTYVLWRRVARALEIYSQGSSLTEAAHAAGFSDSAHLSRTFRRMFGVPAATLEVTSITS